MKKSGLKVSFYLKKSEMSEDGLCPVMGRIIANLLMTLLQKRLNRSWSFSGLATMVRIVLMYYINLNNFFESPDEDLKRILQEAAEEPPNGE